MEEEERTHSSMRELYRCKSIIASGGANMTQIRTIVKSLNKLVMPMLDVVSPTRLAGISNRLLLSVPVLEYKRSIFYILGRKDTCQARRLVQDEQRYMGAK